MQKKTIAKKEGNKKMSILLVLKALEVGAVLIDRSNKSILPKW